MKHYLLTLTLIAFATMACAPMNSHEALPKDSESDNLSQKLSCEIQPTNYALNTHVLSYELMDKFGASFGFDIMSGFFRAIGVSLSLKRARMALTMELVDPIDPSVPLVNARGQADKKQFAGDLNVDMVQAGASLSYYYTTPLSELSKEGLNNGLKDLSKKLALVETTWSSSVIAHPRDNEFVLSVGTIAGLKEKDQFKIFNIEHLWAGQPCNSQYLMSRKSSDDPLAIVEVLEVASNVSLVRVISGDPKDIKLGARAEIHKLVKTGKTRTLLRAISINEIKSEKLMIDNHTEIDLVKLMIEEIKPAVRNFNFYIRENK